MKLTEEQELNARKRFEEDIKNVDNDDVEYAAKKGQKKINDMDKNPPSPLLKMWNDIKLMLELLKAYIKGEYRETPWDTIAAIAGAIIYFVSPIDVIPDFIPVVGYLDDAAIIGLALNFASSDLKKFEEWKMA